MCVMELMEDAVSCTMGFYLLLGKTSMPCSRCVCVCVCMGPRVLYMQRPLTQRCPDIITELQCVCICVCMCAGFLCGYTAESLTLTLITESDHLLSLAGPLSNLLICLYPSAAFLLPTHILSSSASF